MYFTNPDQARTDFINGDAQPMKSQRIYLKVTEEELNALAPEFIASDDEPLWNSIYNEPYLDGYVISISATNCKRKIVDGEIVRVFNNLATWTTVVWIDGEPQEDSACIPKDVVWQYLDYFDPDADEYNCKLVLESELIAEREARAIEEVI